jgi:hypothetical protein
MSKVIEAAIRSQRWKKARQLIRAELKEKPDSHWLLTRLGLTYYEERAYRASLLYSQKAQTRAGLSIGPMGLRWEPTNARKALHGSPSVSSAAFSRR